MIRLVILFLCLFRFLSCVALDNNPIEDKLRKYISHQSARIGVAVILEDGCVIGVNQHESFPMLSVMKFPLALTVLETVKEKHHSLLDTIPVRRSQLHTDTYSPMLLKYPASKDHNISIYELLDFALKSSDNNACDILMDYVGGASVVNKYIHELGIEGIVIKWNENDMHNVLERCFENCSTPVAMAQLMFKFDKYHNDPNSIKIKRIMQSCETGVDRLAKPMLTTNAIIGHKTGSGPIDKETGQIMAVNDVGYIHLPNGKHYSIAVFIAESAHSMDDTSSIIAEISRLVFEEMTNGK